MGQAWPGHLSLEGYSRMNIGPIRARCEAGHGFINSPRWLSHVNTHFFHAYVNHFLRKQMLLVCKHVTRLCEYAAHPVKEQGARVSRQAAHDFFRNCNVKLTTADTKISLAQPAAEQGLKWPACLQSRSVPAERRRHPALDTPWSTEWRDS